MRRLYLILLVLLTFEAHGRPQDEEAGWTSSTTQKSEKTLSTEGISGMETSTEKTEIKAQNDIKASKAKTSTGTGKEKSPSKKNFSKPLGSTNNPSPVSDTNTKQTEEILTSTATTPSNNTVSCEDCFKRYNCSNFCEVGNSCANKCGTCNTCQNNGNRCCGGYRNFNIGNYQGGTFNVSIKINENARERK